MHEVLAGVVLFTALVMALVGLITLARSMMLPAGNVTLRVNKDHAFVVRPGGKLLASLADNEVFLPSACGGAGTCGACRVRVLEGGGAILPTERVHIPRRDVRLGYRLACQVPVKRDVVVEVPDTVLAARRWTCRVETCRNVATFIREIALRVPEGERIAFEAGGYVQIEAPPHHVSFRDFDIGDEYRGEWARFGLLDLESHCDTGVVRAYSMANHPGEPGVILLNVRIATPPPGAPPGTPPGRGSSWLFSRKPGDAVTVSGPHGEFFIHESDAEMVYIGGGAGMAPLRSHIFDLLKRRRTTRRISYWYGARSLREAFYRDEFERLAREHDNFSFHLALSAPLPEDRWDGPVGFIHQVAHDLYLGGHAAPEDAEYYLCGPPMMVASVRAMLDDLGVEPEHIYFDDFGE